MNPQPDKPRVTRLETVRKRYEPAVLEPRRALTGNMGRRLRFLRMTLDLGAISAAHFLAWDLRFKTGLPGLRMTPQDSGPYGLASIISSLVLFGLISANRLHDEDTLFPGSGEFGRLFKAVLQTMIVFPALAFLSHTRSISRSWMLIALVFATAFVGAERYVTRWFIQRERKKGNLRRPVIVIESGANGIARGPVGHEFEILGRYGVEAGIAFLESLHDGHAGEKANNHALSVIVGANGLDDDTVWRVLLHAGHAGCQVFVESPMRSVAPDRMTVRPFGTRTVVRVSPPALTGFQAFRKRAFDFAMSALALIVLSPFLLLLSLAVLITSGRPIFYGQERVGRNGKTFRIWKFRSMRPDSEVASGPVWASTDDPRRTPLGKILRATSLDELPQFWNVLRGQMSLVGPRPERPNFVDEFVGTIDWYEYRHRMRPGITGWAQAHGLRGNTPLDKRVAYDNWYIEHWSIGLDLKICILTVAEVFRGDHAY